MNSSANVNLKRQEQVHVALDRTSSASAGELTSSAANMPGVSESGGMNYIHNAGTGTALETKRIINPLLMRSTKKVKQEEDESPRSTLPTTSQSSTEDDAEDADDHSSMNVRESRRPKRVRSQPDHYRPGTDYGTSQNKTSRRSNRRKKETDDDDGISSSTSKSSSSKNNSEKITPKSESEEDSSVANAAVKVDPAIVAIKQEYGGYNQHHQCAALQHRKYGDRVLLGRQMKNGMMKMGGGNCRMDMYPSIKRHPNHPRFRDLGFSFAIAYSGHWQCQGPKWAGFLGGAVGYTGPASHRGKPFSVFMQRKMGAVCIGWEYCGEYEAVDPNEEMIQFTSAYTIDRRDRDKIARHILTYLKNPDSVWHGELDYWHHVLTHSLENDPSSAADTPIWFREDRRPTIAELDNWKDMGNKRSSMASRARAVGYHSTMTDKDLVEVLVRFDEFHRSEPVRFVEYDERVYNYVKAGETIYNAAGKRRTEGEPCAKASDWYAYYDQKSK